MSDCLRFFNYGYAFTQNDTKANYPKDILYSTQQAYFEIPRQARNDTETNNTILIKTLVIVFAYNCSATTYPPETLPASGGPNALANVLGYK